MPFQLSRGNTECDLCKAVIAQIDHELSGPRTRANVKAALPKACDHLPKLLKPAASQCKKIITLNHYVTVLDFVRLITVDKIIVETMLCTAEAKL